MLIISLVALYSLVVNQALAEPLPIPDPTPVADPQFVNNAPFSGAIYIVGEGGHNVQFSGASPAQCPAHAPQGCGNINVWNWCCPSSNTCAMMNNGVVGCCPVGQNCVGSVAANQITTVTVPAAAVHPGAVTAVVAGGGVYVNGPVAPTTRTIVQGPFCSTLYMNGYPIPTTAPAPCGVMLIMSPPSNAAQNIDGSYLWVLPWFGLHVILGILGGAWHLFR